MEEGSSVTSITFSLVINGKGQELHVQCRYLIATHYISFNLYMARLLRICSRDTLQLGSVHLRFFLSEGFLLVLLQ
jgi:hypothetical protein